MAPRTGAHILLLRSACVRIFFYPRHKEAQPRHNYKTFLSHKKTGAAKGTRMINIKIAVLLHGREVVVDTHGEHTLILTDHRI